MVSGGSTHGSTGNGDDRLGGCANGQWLISVSIKILDARRKYFVKCFQLGPQPFVLPWPIGAICWVIDLAHAVVAVLRGQGDLLRTRAVGGRRLIASPTARGAGPEAARTAGPDPAARHPAPTPLSPCTQPRSPKACDRSEFFLRQTARS